MYFVFWIGRRPKKKKERTKTGNLSQTRLSDKKTLRKRRKKSETGSWIIDRATSGPKIFRPRVYAIDNC